MMSRINFCSHMEDVDKKPRMRPFTYNILKCISRIVTILEELRYLSPMTKYLDSEK